MAFEYNDEAKETGVDVDLEISALPQGTIVPVTSASFSKETDTSEVQFNDSYSQNIAVTGVTYSGSFETAGRNTNLRNNLWEGSPSNEGKSTELPAYVSSMTFTDGNGYEYQFQNCLITTHSKDMPADDRTTMSYDFTAEKLIEKTESEAGS